MSNKERCINEEINANKVNVVLKDGTMINGIDLEKALIMAQDEGLDLVQVSSTENNVPICKIINYGKDRYKKIKIKKKQNKDITKEIKFSLNISDHDLEIKHKKVIEFLSKKYKVRYTLEIRDRVNDSIMKLAKEKMNRNLTCFESSANWQKQKINNRNITVTLIPIVK